MSVCDRVEIFSLLDEPTCTVPESEKSFTVDGRSRSTNDLVSVSRACSYPGVLPTTCVASSLQAVTIFNFHYAVASYPWGPFPVALDFCVLLNGHPCDCSG